MLMYGWMVWVEHAPERYDWAVKVMTFGRIDRMKDDIAAHVDAGSRMLDIGCGTGTLALRCIGKGAAVTGLDSSEFMLNEASRRAAASGQSERLTLIRDSVTQIKKHRDKLEPEGFDVVTATMALGEFPQEYLDYIIRDCHRLLKPGGQIMIGDECWPQNILIRTIYRILMTVFWIPQFLLLRRPLFPIRDLDGIVRKAGFEVAGVKVYRGTSFRLVYGVKQPVRAELAEPPSEARNPESAAVGEA